MKKKTLLIGASSNPARYAYLAIRRLVQQGIEVVPLGIKEGEIDGIPIVLGTPTIENVHTVTLYIRPALQPAYYDYILGLKPQRILFNPGTENAQLMKLAREARIEVEAACTLVMLSLGDY